MALFALRSNGKKIETLEELRENFNAQDMLDNFKTRCLHRWLEINRLFNELAEIKQIQSGNPDEIVSSLLDILKISESTRAEILDKISSNQKRQELSQNYSAAIGRLKELSELLQHANCSAEVVDEFITLPIPISSFIKVFNQAAIQENAVKRIEELADSNSSAKVKLGALYSRGIFVDKNDEKALLLYEQATEAGDSYGMNCLALCYRDGKGCSKDLARYIELLNKSADLGNPVSMTNLGYAFSSGCGVEKSYDKANELYIQASNMGHAAAYANLGVSYEYGYGFEKDLVKAFQFYKIAAEADDCFAQRNIGRCYQYGYGTESDMSQAYIWYLKAAEGGDRVAQYKVGWFLQYGKGNVKKDEAKAVEWYQKSADQNYADGLWGLGFCYDIGEGTGKNNQKAAELYKKASDLGNVRAKRSLGYLYQLGEGVERNIQKAIELYTSAADSGDDLAMKWLGDIFFEDEDELFDAEKALMWYKKAAEAGNEKAILKKFEVLLYSGVDECGFDFLNEEALNALLEAYNKKVPGAESFICFFKYMQYSFEKNSLQKDEEFERVMKFLTEKCSDFDDSIEAWCSALLSESANDISPALLVLGMLITNAEEGGDDLSEIIVGTAFDKSDAEAFLEKAAARNYRLAKKILKDMEL